MRYSEFRSAIQRELKANPDGLTWIQLRETLSLPYRTPCPTWVAQLEKEIGLERKNKVKNALIWKLNLTKE